jgi:hypothetical protein
MKVASSWPIRWVSKPSNASSSWRTSRWVSDRSQRSITVTSPAGAAAPGVQPARRAYSVWNATVFQ